MLSYALAHDGRPLQFSSTLRRDCQTVPTVHFEVSSCLSLVFEERSDNVCIGVYAAIPFFTVKLQIV